MSPPAEADDPARVRQGLRRLRKTKKTQKTKNRRRNGDRSSLGLLDSLDPELELRLDRRAAGPDPDLPARRPTPTASAPRARRSWPAINAIETAFGTNLNISSAGAIGWMQFMPRNLGDATGSTPTATGSATPTTPKTRSSPPPATSSAAGMPADTYGAIYAYNHADWYVAEVLANADCYAPKSAPPSPAPSTSTPQLEGPQLQPGEGLAQADPGRLPGRLRDRRRPLRPRPARASGRWPRSPASSPTSAAG